MTADRRQEGDPGNEEAFDVPLGDDVRGRDAKASVRALCTAIITDPDELTSFLACVGVHGGVLGFSGCVEAVRVGKARSSLLLPATGPDSWAARGHTPKPGTRPLVVARPLGPTRHSVRLFSELDLVRAYTPSLDDLPPDRLSARRPIDASHVAKAFASLDRELPPLVRSALMLRHGFVPSPQELGGSDFCDPELAEGSLRGCVTETVRLTESFDAALHAVVATQAKVIPAQEPPSQASPYLPSQATRKTISQMAGLSSDRPQPTAPATNPSSAEAPGAATHHYKYTFSDSYRPSPTELLRMATGADIG